MPNFIINVFLLWLTVVIGLQLSCELDASSDFPRLLVCCDSLLENRLLCPDTDHSCFEASCKYLENDLSQFHFWGCCKHPDQKRKERNWGEKGFTLAYGSRSQPILRQAQRYMKACMLRLSSLSSQTVLGPNQEWCLPFLGCVFPYQLKYSRQSHTDMPTNQPDQTISQWGLSP